MRTEGNATLSAALATIQVRQPWRYGALLAFLVFVSLYAAVAFVLQLDLLLWLPPVYVLEILLLIAMRNRVRERMLIWRYLEVIEHLEKHPERWAEPGFRGAVNKNIERVAREIERIPKQFHPGDPITRQWLHAQTRGAAAGVRQLKRWTVAPNPFTYTDLLARLTADLRTVVEGRWEQLPQAETPPPKERSRTATVAYVVLALILVVATIASPYLGARLGEEWGAGVGSVVSIGAVFLLSRAGVSTTALSEAAGVAKNVQPKAGAD